MLLNVDQLQKQLDKDEFQEDRSITAFWVYIASINVDQLQKQLDKDEFQEDGSMAAFWMVNNQFQKFTDSQFSLDYDSQMTDRTDSTVQDDSIDEARKKTQERDRNSKTSVMPSARFQSTVDGSKPKPRTYNKELAVSRIFIGHRFSPNKTSAVYEKTSPRSDLRWKPTGRIFKSVGLRWIPTGKLFDSCTSKVDSEPPHGSNVDIPNIHECKQTLDVSAGTSINVQKEQSLDLSADHVSSDPGPQCSTTVLEQDSLSPGPQSQENVPQIAETVTTSNELELLYSPMFSELLNGTSPVVLKSSAVHTADNPDKRQQHNTTHFLPTNDVADPPP
ncbi:hypothetical protein Tco_0672748 [Tanacetum coccineum]